MDKRFRLLLGSVLLVALLTACRAKDYATVYDAQGDQVTTITSHAAIDELSTITGNIGSATTATIPADAKPSYHYVLHQINPKAKINVYVYAKTNALTIRGLPVVSDHAWQISEKDAATLNHLQALE